MKTQTKIILIVAILGVAGFLYYQNQKKIEALKLKLASYNNNPPSNPGNNTSGAEYQKWKDWILTAYAIYGDVEKLFQPGGEFYNKKGAPSKDDVKKIISNPGGDADSDPG